MHGQMSVSDKAAPEDCEGQKKSKAELRAERRAIQVGTATGSNLYLLFKQEEMLCVIYRNVNLLISIQLNVSLKLHS